MGMLLKFPAPGGSLGCVVDEGSRPSRDAVGVEQIERLGLEERRAALRAYCIEYR